MDVVSLRNRMIRTVIALLLVVPACLGQTNGSATTGNQPDEIAAMTAEAKQVNPIRELATVTVPDITRALSVPAT